MLFINARPRAFPPKEPFAKRTKFSDSYFDAAEYWTIRPSRWAWILTSIRSIIYVRSSSNVSKSLIFTGRISEARENSPRTANQLEK